MYLQKMDENILFRKFTLQMPKHDDRSLEHLNLQPVASDYVGQGHYIYIGKKYYKNAPKYYFISLSVEDAIAYGLEKADAKAKKYADSEQCGQTFEELVEHLRTDGNIDNINMFRPFPLLDKISS